MRPSFRSGIPHPPLSMIHPKVDTNVIHVIKCTRPSPSVFAINAHKAGYKNVLAFTIDELMFGSFLEGLRSHKL